ncbi:MAG: trehalose-phosphatase, partial [Candidatus Binatia bacterium]
HLADHVGLDVEKKRFSLAVHYRGAPDRDAARCRIDAAVAALPTPVRTVAGILVVNIVPEGAPHKGDALLELLAVEGAETALYVGDDVTDEDVFRLDPAPNIVGVRVGECRASSAKYFLKDQQEMDDLLKTLAGLREGEAA